MIYYHTFHMKSLASSCQSFVLFCTICNVNVQLLRTSYLITDSLNSNTKHGLVGNWKQFSVNVENWNCALMTTENNPGQLFTAVDVDFTNITKHRDISQMNRSKPFQQFDPEKTSFLFRNLLYCKDKDANVVIKWKSLRLVPSKFSIITSHKPFYMPFSHSSPLLRRLHLPGHLRLCHGRRHPQHPPHGSARERCKLHNFINIYIGIHL